MSDEPILVSGEPRDGAPKRFYSIVSIPLFEDDDGTRQGVRLEVRACTNPDCACKHLFVNAQAYDEACGEAPNVREPSFEFVFDVERSVPIGLGSPRTAEEAGLQSALRGALRRKTMRELLRRDFDEQRARIEPAPDPHYDFSPHEDGTLAAYNQVYPDGGYLTFEHEGMRYAIDDQWCVRPECPCLVGIVDLLPLPEGLDLHSEAELDLESIGSCTFPGGEPVEGARALDGELVKAALHERARGWLTARRDRLRAEAARRWVFRRARPPSNSRGAHAHRYELGDLREKVGRNERCPCGSGKKFKRCCLRAEP